MSNSSTKTASLATSKVEVVDSRLKGIAYGEAFKIDPDTLEASLADFIYEVWYHDSLLFEARWAEETEGEDKWDADWRDEEGEGPWEAAIQAYNS